MSMIVGQKFPNMNLSAVMADGSTTDSFNVQEYGQGGYTVVFFYPKDFTFVCPTEIVAFDKAVQAFASRNTKVIGVSVDDADSHSRWRQTDLKEGGIGPVNYPLIADDTKALSNALNVVHPEEGVTFRASYLIDKDGVVRHMVVNDLPLGRSVEEMVRMVDALAFHEEHGEVCPANWHKGEEAIEMTTESTGAYLAKKHGTTSAA